MRAVKEVAESYFNKYPTKGCSEIVSLIIQHERGYENYNRESLRSQLQKHKRKLSLLDSKLKKPKSFHVSKGVDEIFAELNPQSHNPFGLPKSENDSAKVFHFPIACNNILVISDLHFPFHSISAITAALRHGLDHKVNTILINGDLIDFYALSRFEKDKKLRNLQNELDVTRQFLSKLRELFPNAHIYYKYGNHDVRWERYIKLNAAEFDGMDEFLLQTILHLPKHHIIPLHDKTLIHAGKLVIVHGHELYGGGGVTPAKGLYNKAGCNALMSHVHRTSEYIDRNLKSETIGCWSIGCLSELRPEYNPAAKYNHGFAHVTTGEDGMFEVKNIKVIDGKIR